MTNRERPRLSAKRWAETADSGFTPTVVKLPDGTQFFSPKKAGTYRLEIIPYEVPANPKGGQNPNAQVGELHYERTYFAHRGIGADEKSYVCPAKTAGKPCPICEHRKELMRDKDADEDLIKALAPKQRQLWNIYDHGDSEKGVQIWDVSFHLFGKQLKATINNADEDDGWEYFADPADGLTLRVGMEEKSFAGNSFLEAASIGFKARKEPLSDEILDAAQPLDDLLILVEYSKLKSIFLQEEGLEYDDELDQKKERKPKVEEDGEPAPKKEKSKSDPTKETIRKSSQEVESPGDKSSDGKKPSKPVTAADLGIGKGDDCRLGGKNWTIIRVSEDGTTVTLSNDDDEIRKGVPVDQLQPPSGTDDDSSKKELAPAADESGKKAGARGSQAGSAAAQNASPSKAKDEEDWDEGFDEPKKESKPAKTEKSKQETKVKDEPKDESKKETKADADWDDDWS